MRAGERTGGGVPQKDLKWFDVTGRILQGGGGYGVRVCPRFACFSLLAISHASPGRWSLILTSATSADNQSLRFALPKVAQMCFSCPCVSTAGKGRC